MYWIKYGNNYYDVAKATCVERLADGGLCLVFGNPNSTILITFGDLPDEQIKAFTANILRWLDKQVESHSSKGSL